MQHRVPADRIAVIHDAPVRAQRDYVLYWMIAFRRVEWNFSLQRAVEWARELDKPLLIFEPLRIGYRWASARIHRFVIDGMSDNAAAIHDLGNSGVHYFPYVEPTLDADKGLLLALAEQACVIVTDNFPSFFLPRMVQSAAKQMPVQVEQVDSNGLLPLTATERVFTTAHSFRAYLQKSLPPYLEQPPVAEPLKNVKLPRLRGVPGAITDRWPTASKALLEGSEPALAKLPIDHAVAPVERRGGTLAARKLLQQFIRRHLEHYTEEANQPDANARSGLSPYLHFGHLSPHEMFHTLMTHEKWSPEQLSTKTGGKREGWWNVSAGAESWLDEFVTWRELGYNLTSHTSDYDQYDSLPEWARATLEKHQKDKRPKVYTLEQLDRAETYDPVWNAAQRQLVQQGQIHNYLRMLWGKKILEWSPTPQAALDVMIELNNRYALDGRNPNSYSGIFWCLGRYDRAWGPERPIFGTVRYMSSDSTVRKLRLKEYLREFGPDGK